MKMKKNVGQIDQIIRYVIALGCIVLAITINPLFFLVSAILIFTALFQFCGLYTLLGITTCKINDKT